MPKPKPIQISIPNPCHQSWDEMTPQGQGRHCAHCQKVVTDFTSWSDTALFDFFIKNKNKEVCGRFKHEQLNRRIVPHQPQSKLYRLFIGLGLTLILVQLPVQQTFAKPPFTYLQHQNQNEGSANTNTTTDSVRYVKMKGVIVNYDGRPIVGAIIRVERHNVPHYVNIAECGAITDVDGSFMLDIPMLDKNLNAYVLSVDHNEYSGRIISLRDYVASEDKYVRLKLEGLSYGVTFIREWYRPAVNNQIAFLQSFLEDEIINTKR